MNSSEIFESKLNEILESMTAEINTLQSKADELELKAKEAREKIEDKKRELEKIKSIIDISQEMLAYTKTIEKIVSTAPSMKDLEDVIEELETSAEPDFKSARDKLGIKSAEEEDTQDPPTTS